MYAPESSRAEYSPRTIDCWHFLRTLFAALFVASLYAACGGDGDGGNNAPPAVTPTAPTLSGLTVSTASVSPAFAAGTTAYTVTLPFLANAPTLTPTGATGTITVDGTAVTTGAASQTLAVDPGASRLVNVVVTSAGLSTTYGVTLTRQAAASFAQQAFVKASNADVNDSFYNVALSSDGNTMAVGAVGEASNAVGIGGSQTDNSKSDAGAVYVFTRSGATWAQQAYIKASNSDAGDNFGTGVALSSDGNTLVVGAENESSNATGINGNGTDNSKPQSGAAYVFTRSGATWSQQAYVKASNTDAGDHFGDHLALSADGNTMVVGSEFEASAATGINGSQIDNTKPGAGAAYVFTRSSGAWTQQAYIKASNTDAGDDFGFFQALSADGNTLAIGADGEASNAAGINGDQSNNSKPGAGAVYVYTRANGAWTQQAYIKASNPDSGDIFVIPSISADGNTLAVGAFGEASSATGIGGLQTDNSKPNAGAVYVFTRSGTTWAQQAYLKASNSDTGDFFAAVALTADGNTLAVGAPGESSNAIGIGGNQADNSFPKSGAVYIFTRTGATWSQKAYVKASNTVRVGTGDKLFGFPVAIAADGTLAVGAEEDDVSSSGINGAQTATGANPDYGAVYVFK